MLENIVDINYYEIEKMMIDANRDEDIEWIDDSGDYVRCYLAWQGTDPFKISLFYSCGEVELDISNDERMGDEVPEYNELKSSHAIYIRSRATVHNFFHNPLWILFRNVNRGRLYGKG